MTQREPVAGTDCALIAVVCPIAFASSTSSKAVRALIGPACKLREVCAGRLRLYNKKKSELIQELHALGFTAHSRAEGMQRAGDLTAAVRRSSHVLALRSGATGSFVASC